MVNTVPAQRGFTLIELSIVLVIIGFIVGGIVTGQDLIHAARLRKVGSELRQMSVAVTTFKLKYDCLPGDCANATSFFGTLNGSCPNVYSSGLTGTCNGDGDGRINSFHSDGNVEATWAVQQLGLAGLIPWVNSYGGGWTTVTPVITVPASSFNSSIGYYLFTPSPSLASFYMGAAPAGYVVIQIGALRSDGTDPDFLFGTGFTAPDSFALDSKIDDGVPNGGLLQGADPYTADGSTGTSNINPNATCLSATRYAVSPATGCVLYYRIN